ncbi:MAG: hypothetical protein NZM35_00535 [Chitinophagales bacterium]|nr:hypothetical protein [Chitinophagales bacterium]MDW8417804.1 hypothetical protein [Chitinophagales bacterium]
MSGQLSDGLVLKTYHLGLFPASWMIGMLHYLVPTWPWTGIIILLQWTVILASIACMLPIDETIDKYNTTLRILLYVISWLILALGCLIIPFQEFSVTGVGVVSSAVGAWGIYLHITRTSGVKNICTILFFTLLCFGGYMWRWEAGLGGTILFAIYVFWFDDLKNVLKGLLIPGIIAVILFIGILVQLRDHYFFKVIEPMIFYVTDARTPPPIDSTSYRKMLAQSIIRASFISDTTIVNYNHVYELYVRKKMQEINQLKEPFKTIRQSLINMSGTVKKCSGISFAYLYVFAAGMMILAMSGRKSEVIRVVLFNLTVWLVIILTAYVMKMEPWHYTPILQTTLLFNLVNVIFPISNSGNIAIILVPAFLSVINFGNFYHMWKKEQQEILTKKVARSKFIRPSVPYVFIDVDTKDILDDRVFTPMKLPANIYFYDLGQLTHLTPFKNKLSKACNCNFYHADEFFRFVDSKSDSILYVSTAQRVQLINLLTTEFYQMRLLFTAVDSANVTVGTQEIPVIYAFKVKVISS